MKKLLLCRNVPAAERLFLPFILRMEILIILMPVTAKAIFIR